jgi:adenylate cyclase
VRSIDKFATKAALLRLLPDIGYGTEGYPEKVARRLRAFNITAWISASLLVFFTVVRLFDPMPGRWKVAVVTAIVAAIYMALPLLHRFGPWFAINTMFVVFLGYNLRVTDLIGTAGGNYFFYYVAVGLALLFYGTERTISAIVVAVVSVAVLIAEQRLMPVDTGFLPRAVLLNVNYITNVIISAVVLFAVVYYVMRQVDKAEAAAAREYARSEALLANILPADVAARLKEAPGSEIADSFSQASILFADMEGYTSRANDLTPSELVRFLNRVYSRFDAIVEKHGLEKIKTAGDSYMVVSGVPVARPDHAAALARLALEMREVCVGLVDPIGRSVPIRMGIASGPVVAGIVGVRKYSYDVWGDAVNMASRMETTGKAGMIQVPFATYYLLKDQFELAERESIDVRGKGSVRTWFLVGPKASMTPPNPSPLAPPPARP